jgi:light-regulated signal transduction histidine kinase (bacteriophytochrome)
VEGATPSIQTILEQYFTNSNVVYDHLDGMTQFLLMAINRSQDFVKAKSGVAIKPSLETIDIVRTAELVKKVIDNQDNGRQVIIHPIDASSELCPTIITDRQFFFDNLLCLVSNACKYSDKGTVVDVTMQLISENTITINKNNYENIEWFRIDNSTGNKKVLVSVEDNGIGISLDDQKNLFEPFRQAQRRTGGTGLGLYSLKKRMQALYGDCGLIARKDRKQGSVFWFSFPYRPDTQLSTSIMTSNLTETLHESNSTVAVLTNLPSNQTIDVSPMIPIPKLRILLTDDSPSILKVTSRFLKMNGHDVTTAENGSEALKLINSDELIFDVLVTDLQMPVSEFYV